MVSLKETIDSMKFEIDCQIHFNECWDETMFLTLAEVEDWLDDIETVIKRKDMSSQKKLQYIVDSVTGCDNV